LFKLSSSSKTEYVGVEKPCSPKPRRLVRGCLLEPEPSSSTQAVNSYRAAKDDELMRLLALEFFFLACSVDAE